MKDDVQKHSDDLRIKMIPEMKKLVQQAAKQDFTTESEYVRGLIRKDLVEKKLFPF